MIEPNLTFTANSVKFKMDGDELFGTSSIYLGEGDPGQDENAWTFYRKKGDDWGVWIVRGTQQRGLHDGIEEFILSRSRLECAFTKKGADETGINTLTILYDINEESWQGLANTAISVFQGCTGFKLLN